MSNKSDLIVNIAIGLVAGAIGTAVMTATQTAQMKATGREGSTTPAKGAEKVFGLDPWTDQEEENLSNQVHWSYGVTLGGAFGLLASALGEREPATGAAFFCSGLGCRSGDAPGA